MACLCGMSPLSPLTAPARPPFPAQLWWLRWPLWWRRWWLQWRLQWRLWQLQQLQVLPGGLLLQLLPLLPRLLWGVLQRARDLLLPPPLQLVWLRRGLREGLLPAEVLLPAELRLQEAVLLLGRPAGLCLETRKCLWLCSQQLRRLSPMPPAGFLCASSSSRYWNCSGKSLVL
ncbi:uncharacterized protein LOC123644097 [Lemur catta]|uniref:uncharacterized protein LOC123644097 n=1 Tax=Lemur catta TaxID=9447 RepID=UPI001E26B0CE|nr:uncharacterized protein LOC123644097 [Lemur catta]